MSQSKPSPEPVKKANASQQMARRSHPPKAPLVFRVGVTGHIPDPKKRPMPDEQQLRQTCREVLLHVHDAVGGVAGARGNEFDLETQGNGKKSARLRIISALAEGPDRWVVQEAQKLDYELQCPLPFSREEYKKDFGNDASRDEFKHMIGKATAVMELDGFVGVDAEGQRTPSSSAYEAVGDILLNQTDLLIAVWDGQLPKGRGGTGAVVDDALNRGIPVVWVLWSSPNTWILRLPKWRLLREPADIQGDVSRLKRQVQDLLLPPAEATDEPHSRTTVRGMYFAEEQKSGNYLYGWWQIFLALFTSRILSKEKPKKLPRTRKFRVAGFESATQKDWAQQAHDGLLDKENPHTAAPELAASIDDAYLRHYAWANGLSVYYANLYRSAFVVSFLLAAAAVFLALVSLPISEVPKLVGLPISEDPKLVSLTGKFVGYAKYVMTGAEFLAIVAIFGMTSYGRNRHWHERSVDYRMLAERLRLARFLAILGGGGADVSISGHLATYGNPSSTWMHWHYRAVERAAGLQHVSFTEDYLEASKACWLNMVLQDQIAYHEQSHSRYEKLDHRIHVLGIALFLSTLAACVLHFIVEFFMEGARFEGLFEGLLTLAAAVLPATAAALFAIRTQAEAPRLSRRSDAMRQSLRERRQEMASVSTRAGEGNSQDLRVLADRVTELMVREMLDWRVVLLDRPLETHI